MNQNQPTLTVILPFYRCADAHRELADRLKTALSAFDSELVVIDDACPDSSGIQFNTLALESGFKTQLIQHARNLGQHRSVLAGLKLAKGLQHVVMDADLQDPPEFITDLLQALQNPNIDIVTTSRYQSIPSRLIKRLSAQILSSPAVNGMFFALSNSARIRLLECNLSSPWLPAVIAQLNLPAITLEYKKQPRISSGYSIGGRARLALKALDTTFRLRNQV